MQVETQLQFDFCPQKSPSSVAKIEAERKHVIKSIADFDGSTYVPQLDAKRLCKQGQAVFNLMADGKWRTLREICQSIGVGSEAGVSARLRDFRKAKFGGYVVNRQRRGLAEDGVFEYQLRVKP